MATQYENRKLREWNEYLENIQAATPVETDLTPAERERKRLWLEARPLEWIQYFFPDYAKYEFAPFQKKAIGRMIDNKEWFEVLSWSRELAKSTVVMFVVMYLALTGRKRNVILASATQAAAEKLLRPYRGNLEANGRIKAFYGDQMIVGQWTDTEFTARCGCSFMGIGAGNAPRGSRNKSVRPDVLLVDDFDTDEECRNPATLDKKWDWWERALWPTRAISEPTLVVFCGNIIAKDTCVARAGAKADHWDIVNVVDKNGRSSWPQKNSDDDIARIRSKISTAAFQGEYMNNPISEGKIFHNLPVGKVPDLKKFRFLMCYGDPAYSNSKRKESSTKAVILTGVLKGRIYVIKAFCGHATNAEYIEWFYKIKTFVGKAATVYYYQENNALQSAFFDQVFKPLIREANERKGENLYINGDGRDKIDKATRIEANLEPIDRDGGWVFNEDEQDNPHMKELMDQLRLFEMSMPYPADGPDCLEGGINLMYAKIRSLDPGTVIPYSDFTGQNPFRM